MNSDDTVRKRFFRDNFVTFRRRSKRTAFLESVNFSTSVYMQISHFLDGHVTTFRHPSGAYLPDAWSQTLQSSERHTFRVSAFYRYHWFGVKLFPVGCALIVEGYTKNAKNAVLDLAPPTLQNSGIFHDSTRPYFHFDGLPPKSRQSVVSI